MAATHLISALAGTTHSPLSEREGGRQLQSFGHAALCVTHQVLFVPNGVGHMQSSSQESDCLQL